jgi:transcription elongation factor GreA
MIYYATKNQLNKEKNEFKKLENKIKELRRKLTFAASRGGSLLPKNPEFASLMEELSILSIQAKHLKEKIDQTKIIKFNEIDNSKVSTASKITLKNLQNNTITYLSFIETNDKSIKQVSQNSPVGKTIMKKKENEIINVNTPKGKINFKILKIERLPKNLNNKQENIKKL